MSFTTSCTVTLKVYDDEVPTISLLILAQYGSDIASVSLAAPGQPAAATYPSATSDMEATATTAASSWGAGCSGTVYACAVTLTLSSPGEVSPSADGIDSYAGMHGSASATLLSTSSAMTTVTITASF